MFFGLLAFAMALLPGNVFANKSAVSIQVPSAVPRGSEAVIRVTVTHDANNFLHYTEWLYVKVNGKEIARWKYTSSEQVGGRNLHQRDKVHGDGQSGDQGGSKLQYTWECRPRYREGSVKDQ